MTAVLPNDRYIVSDMAGSRRTTRKATYQNTVAVDRMKPWRPSGGLSDDSDDSSGDEQIVLSDVSDISDWEDPGGDT